MSIRNSDLINVGTVKEKRRIVNLSQNQDSLQATRKSPFRSPPQKEKNGQNAQDCYSTIHKLQYWSASKSIKYNRGNRSRVKTTFVAPNIKINSNGSDFGIQNGSK